MVAPICQAIERLAEDHVSHHIECEELFKSDMGHVQTLGTTYIEPIDNVHHWLSSCSTLLQAVKHQISVVDDDMLSAFHCPLAKTMGRLFSQVPVTLSISLDDASLTRAQRLVKSRVLGELGLAYSMTIDVVERSWVYIR